VSLHRRVFGGCNATAAAELKSTCCSVINACVSVAVGREVTVPRLSSYSMRVILWAVESITAVGSFRGLVERNNADQAVIL
jgi:hypothetical protein